MNEQLIGELRFSGNEFKDWPRMGHICEIMLQAADAIEELQATICNWCAVCPEDKRDLSTCEIYESCRAKPPKEE